MYEKVRKLCTLLFRPFKPTSMKDYVNGDPWELRYIPLL